MGFHVESRFGVEMQASIWQSTLGSKSIAKLQVQVIMHSWRYVHHVGDVVGQASRRVGMDRCVQADVRN